MSPACATEPCSGRLARFRRCLLRRSRPRLRFSRKVAAALVDEAVESLAQGKAMHDELEALYNPHVDFGRVHTIADSIRDELLHRHVSP